MELKFSLFLSHIVTLSCDSAGLRIRMKLNVMETNTALLEGKNSAEKTSVVLGFASNEAKFFGLNIFFGWFTHLYV